MTADFAIITAGLKRSRDRFESGLDFLKQYEDAGVLRASDFTDLKGRLNRALEESWDSHIKERFTYGGKWQDLSDDDKKLYDAVDWPACHKIEGMLRRAEKSKNEGAMRTAMIEWLTAAAPLAARVNALKDKIGTPPPRVTKTSIERAEREAKAMTCQCCGRGILAETGVIAHHGYERPGMGWQTASCYGARYEPFEVSRDRLGEMIVSLKNAIERGKAYRAKVTNEEVPITWTYGDISERKHSWEKAIPVSVSVTRDTLPAILNETREKRAKNPDPTFDAIKASRLAEINAEIASDASRLERAQERFKAWKGPTHTYADGAWAAL